MCTCVLQRSLNTLFVSAFAHADGIRILAANIEDSEQQVAVVRSYANSIGLQQIYVSVHWLFLMGS